MTADVERDFNRFAIYVHKRDGTIDVGCWTESKNVAQRLANNGHIVVARATSLKLHPKKPLVLNLSAFKHGLEEAKVA